MVGFTGSKRLLEKAWQGSHMTIDDDTLKQLLRINDGLFQLCKRLNEKQEIEISSRLIPLVDELTHILLEAGKNKLH